MPVSNEQGKNKKFTRFFCYFSPKVSFVALSLARSLSHTGIDRTAVPVNIALITRIRSAFGFVQITLHARTILESCILVQAKHAHVHTCILLDDRVLGWENIPYRTSHITDVDIWPHFFDRPRKVRKRKDTF